MKRLGLLLEAEAAHGGIFQYSQAMVEALAALSADFDVHVACTSRSWQRYLLDKPFHVTWLRQARFGLKFATLFKAILLPGWLARPLSALVNPLYRQLRRLDCDLWIYPAPDALAYQLPLPALIAIHDLMHRYEGQFPEVGGGWRYYIRDHRFGEMARWARGVLVDSEIGRRHVVESYGIEPDKVFALPYIAPRYIREARDTGDVAARYGLPAKFFFYPAQLWSHKNHKRLISAAASLKDEYPDIHLVFTGKGRHSYREIAAHARSENMLAHVTFLGYLPDADLPGLYARARALVMPTFLGPTNIPPLEAFGCGCPVAVSGIYGMPEQLGDSALYFDPKSASDIALSLRRLWQDDALCAELARRGRLRAAALDQASFNRRLSQIVDRLT